MAAILLLLLALAGVGYTLFAARLVVRLEQTPALPPVAAEPVTLLKPLHGAEPKLAENLATFLDQAWDAPIEMICGIQRADDPAIGMVGELTEQTNLTRPFVRRTNGEGAGSGKREVALIVDPTPHGANAKVANLRNMIPAASHDLLVLSDSDIAVPRDYLATIAAALARPGVGAVSCLYRGRGDAGFWSVLAAAGSSWQFLPSVLVGIALGQGRPCMGSTIALRRDTLDRIGGFAAFADTLADDHAIGAAVRALGLKVAIPPMVLVHAAGETSLRELVRHELRWAATVRGLVPGAVYLGSIVTFPLPLALLAIPISPLAGGAMAAAALTARLLLAARIDRVCGVRTAPLWLLPARDILSFVLFVASFGVRSVDWRGARLRMERDGRIAPERSRQPS